MNSVYPDRWSVVPFAVLAALALALPAYGQGFIQVATFSPGDFGTPLAVFAYDQDGLTPLYGAAYSAQLFAGPAGTAEAALQPVGTPLSFDRDDGLLPVTLGGTSSAVVSIPGVPGGQKAQAQLRVWENGGGLIQSWETALVRGQSASFLSPTLAASKEPTFQVPPLTGIKSFQLLPAITAVAAIDGAFSPAFFNDHYSSPFFRVASSQNPRLAGDGRSYVVQFTPDSNATDPARHNFYRRARGATSLPEPTVLAFPGDAHSWTVTGLSADGSILTANQGTESGPKAYLWRDGALATLPVRLTLGLSGDGRRVFAVAANGDFVRHDWLTGSSLLLRAADSFQVDVIAVSHEGRVALVNREIADGKPGQALWIEGRGLVTDAIPTGFRAFGLSGDGDTVVGMLDQRPAVVSLKSPPPQARILGAEIGATGAFHDCSFDGSILCGAVTVPRGRLVVFTAEGRGFGLNELLPNAGVKTITHAAGVQISDDGRTLFGTSHSNLGSTSDSGWIADLVFPGDGPALSPRWSDQGRPQLTFPTRTGFRYQLRHSPTLGSPTGSWAKSGEALTGDDQPHTFELAGDSGSGFYALETATVMP